MNKQLSISQRGQLSVKHADKRFFYVDMKLFNKHLPESKLSTTLAGANQFNMDKLHANMLYELLAVVTEEDILKNRITPFAPAKGSKTKTTGKAKATTGNGSKTKTTGKAKASPVKSTVPPVTPGDKTKAEKKTND